MYILCANINVRGIKSVLQLLQLQEIKLKFEEINFDIMFRKKTFSLCRIHR